VGDQNVLAAMREHDLNVGGEQSGHIIVRDFSTTGDGLIAALQILRVMKTRGKPLSELARCWTRFPQLLTNIVVREKKPLEQLDGVAKLMAQAEAHLKAQGGRVLLRYSGTEPKCVCCWKAATPARWNNGAGKFPKCSKKSWSK
jgi:phosphoglucosamine mutase